MFYFCFYMIPYCGIILNYHNLPDIFNRPFLNPTYVSTFCYPLIVL